MIILFFVSLYICIIMHELGHLLTAKLVKCNVEVFSIGFGKELFSFKYKGTKYRFALLPFGGYNKLEHELDYCKNKYALPNLSYTKKLLVLLSGCIINILAGIGAIIIGHYLIPFINPIYISCFYFGGKLIYTTLPTLWTFGFLSIILGLSNLLPIPALDGSYPILFLIEKVIPKKYALQFIRFLVQWGFIILNVLNIICLPYMIYLIIKGIV